MAESIDGHRFVVDVEGRNKEGSRDRNEFWNVSKDDILGESYEGACAEGEVADVERSRDFESVA